MTPETTEAKAPYVYRPKTDEELKTVALGIISGTIVSSLNVKPEMLHMVFMPLGFMSAEHLEDMERAEITLIYEELSAAGPRSINGMPMFMSCHQLNKTDHERLLEMITKIQDAIDGV